MWNKLLRLIAVLLILVFGVYTVVDVVRFPLAYDSVARYHLLNDLNDRQPKAMELYRNNYVNYGRYLFQGELTFNMICSRNNVSTHACSILYTDYLQSHQPFKKYVNTIGNP